MEKCWFERMQKRQKTAKKNQKKSKNVLEKIVLMIDIHFLWTREVCVLME